MSARVRRLALALALLPGLIVDPGRRALLAQMRAFCRALPQALEAPLSGALDRMLAMEAQAAPYSPDTLRRLADLAALLERRSPLGLCLRRSLTRAHFLRRAGVPVAVQFGAKFVDGRPDRAVTGHAWLTLDGQPYFEDEENWREFTVMLAYPPLRPDMETDQA